VRFEEYREVTMAQASLRIASPAAGPPGTTVSAHPLTAYFALTFAISWGGVLLVIARSGPMTEAPPTGDPLFGYAVLAMLAGPTVASILLTALLDGKDGLRALASRARAWRASAWWHAAALLMAPTIWTATLVALALVSSDYRPAILTTSHSGSLVLVGLAVGLGAGIFEEIGWTGFAIPRFRRRHGVLATGVMVGVVWAAWHLLTNVVWASAVTAGDLPMSIFLPTNMLGVLVGYLVAFRVLMVWVYDRTQSLLLAMVMHASLTATVLTLDPVGLTGASLLFYSCALAAAAWIAVGTVVARVRL
jgi:uncharacterized protein